MNDTISLHLRQTAAWCLQSFRRGFALRSQELRPDLLVSDDPLTQLYAIHDHQGSLPASVSAICDRRSQLIEELRISVPSIDDCEIAGRVLCTDFDSDSCAAATVPSFGYFNDCDIPGWDSWFAYQCTDRYTRVYCWVPNEMYDAVNHGINVIPVECVWWVDRIPETAK